jgi:mannose-6-phosphate isomerase-like protein (cupin superfamily)
MKASLGPLLASLPRPATSKWPDGEPFATAIEHGSMSLEVFAPRRDDRQEPHNQDELYIIVAGKAAFHHQGVRTKVAAGDALFVKAGDAHHFEQTSPDFVSWVVFWGPKGGEG